jgi:hypothetical protein
MIFLWKSRLTVKIYHFVNIVGFCDSRKQKGCKERASVAGKRWTLARLEG